MTLDKYYSSWKCICCWNHYKKPTRSVDCFSLVLLDLANQSLSRPWLGHMIPPLEDKAACCGRLTSTQHRVFPQRRTLWSGLWHALDCPAWGFRMRTLGNLQRSVVDSKKKMFACEQKCLLQGKNTKEWYNYVTKHSWVLYSMMLYNWTRHMYL